MIGFYISLCFLAELLSEHLFFKYGVLNKRLRDIDFIFPCIFIVEGKIFRKEFPFEYER